MRIPLLFACLALTACVTDPTEATDETSVTDEAAVTGAEPFPLLADLTWDVNRPVIALRCFDATNRFAFRLRSFFFLEAANQPPNLYVVNVSRAFDLEAFSGFASSELLAVPGSATKLLGVTQESTNPPDLLNNTALSIVSATRGDGRRLTATGIVAGARGTWGCELFARGLTTATPFVRVL